MHFEAQSEALSLSPEQQARIESEMLSRATEALKKADDARTDEETFYAAPAAALAAFRLDQFDRATELAQKTLLLAPAYEKNWNFGNAIHYGHTVRGLLALRSGDIQLAVAELQRAGATRGSPQLNSFGPSMQLAKTLLQHGEFESVLGYLNQCRALWKVGTAWLDVWEQKIRRKEVPNFAMHAYG